jgi:hypothetical protein
MSDPDTLGGGLGMLIAETIQMGLNMRRKAKARRMIRDLIGELRDVERRDAERRQAAVEAVRRQMARGDAGNATAEQRRQAGRNPLDERFF